ncbi:hypothetical protein [Lentilactobacillus kefiri]|uniref:hypothetical protein n=1 Tax=Lentilactobacillus kefiri TaxID=33962 RepID=UPI0020738199|nr:hypothetical protein [Lentilactobacillus kefiri]
MKKILPLIGISLTGVLLLAGCGHKQADKEDASTAPSSSTKLNNLLSPAKAKVPDDSQSSNGDQLYSQFYKKGGQWYWKLTSQDDGTIDNSQIKSLKSTGQNDVYNFSMVSNKNKSYNMKFNWINGGHQAYTVNAAYHNVNNNFVLADAKVSGQWQTGAPQAVQGTWATDFTNNSGNDAQKLPFTKQFLNITSTATSSFVNEYDTNHRLYNSETANKTTNVSYKQDGDNYVLKSYDSNETPVVYSISVMGNNEIKVDGLTSSSLTMSQSATSPTTSASESSAVTFQSGSAAVSGSTANTTTSHLTDQQVVNWIWPYVKAKYPNMNVESTDFTYMPQMKNGQMYVNVLENHNAAAFKKSGVDSGTNPQVASFRVTSSGALEQMDATTGDWSVVSSGYNG